MALIGRYLPATVHTSYNVRDWGKSTGHGDADRPRGPRERDCGVYALTVA